MYRVSREGRRASNGSTDTPPRTLKQRISKLHSYVPPNGSKDKPYLQDPRVRLGLKIAGVLLALVVIRQVHNNMCYARYDSTVQLELTETQTRLAETEAQLKNEHTLYLGLENELSVLKMMKQATERDGADLIKLRSTLDEKEQYLLVANQELQHLRQQNDDMRNKIAALEAGAPQKRMVLTSVERNSDGGGRAGVKAGDADVIPPILKVPSSDDGTPDREAGDPRNNGEGGLPTRVGGEAQEEISGKYSANQKSYRFGKHAKENMSEAGLSRNRLSPSHWIMGSSFTSDGEAHESFEEDRSKDYEGAPRGTGVAAEKGLHELKGSGANGAGGSSGEAGGSQDSYLMASSSEEEEESELKGRFGSGADSKGDDHPDSKWPSPEPGEAQDKAWGGGAGEGDSVTEDFKVIAMRSDEAEGSEEAVEPVKSAAPEDEGVKKKKKKSGGASKKSNLRGKAMDIMKKDASDASDATNFYAVELEESSASEDKPLPVVTNIDVPEPEEGTGGVGGEVGRDASERSEERSVERIKDRPEERSAEDLQEWFDREMKRQEEADRMKDGGDDEKSFPVGFRKPKKFMRRNPKEQGEKEEEAYRPVEGSGVETGGEKLGDKTRETGTRSVAGESRTASRDGDPAGGEKHAAFERKTDKRETRFGKKAERQRGERKRDEQEQAEREQAELEKVERERAEPEQAEREQAELEKVERERARQKPAEIEQDAKGDATSWRSSEPADEAEAISGLKKAMEKEEQVPDASESSSTATEQETPNYDPKFGESSSEQQTTSKGDDEEASEEDEETEDEEEEGKSLSSTSSGENSEETTDHGDSEGDQYKSPEASKSSESLEASESSESPEASESSESPKSPESSEASEFYEASESPESYESAESSESPESSEPPKSSTSESGEASTSSSQSGSYDRGGGGRESRDSFATSTSSREQQARGGAHRGKRQGDGFTTDDLTSSESALGEGPPREFMEIPKGVQKNRDAITNKHMAILRGASSRRTR